MVSEPYAMDPNGEQTMVEPTLSDVMSALSHLGEHIRTIKEDNSKINQRLDKLESLPTAPVFIAVDEPSAPVNKDDAREQAWKQVIARGGPAVPFEPPELPPAVANGPPVEPSPVLTEAQVAAMCIYCDQPKMQGQNMCAGHWASYQRDVLNVPTPKIPDVSMRSTDLELARDFA